MERQDNNTQAADILQQVDTIAVAGSRRFWSRALPNAVLSIAMGIGSASATIAMGLFGGYLLLEQGVVAQLAGAAHVYDDIKPAHAASVYSIQNVHPLLQAGLDADGFINKDRLFASWSAAGIDEDTATRLITHLWAAGAVVESPDGMPQDIAAHRFDPQALSSLPLPAAESIVYDPSLDVPAWAQASQKYNDAIHGLGFGETSIEFARTAGEISPEEARQHLLKAVEFAGLASYSVPLDAMSSPRAMYGHADALMLLNDELSEVSGWEGQVAGLGGRIHWVPAIEAGVMATTRMVGDTLMIKGAANSYAHEFIHAIDFTIMQAALVGNHRLTLSEDHGLMRLVQDKSINEAHHGHIQQLRQDMPDFHSSVDALRDKSPLSFMPDEVSLGGVLSLTSATEVIARSFEMHVLHQGMNKATAGYSANRARESRELTEFYGLHYMYPNHEEAQSQSKAWNTWFSKLKPLGLSDPYTESPALAQETNLSSHLSCALSARRGMGASLPIPGCAKP